MPEWRKFTCLSTCVLRFCWLNSQSQTQLWLLCRANEIMTFLEHLPMYSGLPWIWSPRPFAYNPRLYHLIKWGKHIKQGAFFHIAKYCFVPSTGWSMLKFISLKLISHWSLEKLIYMLTLPGPNKYSKCNIILRKSVSKFIFYS